MIAPRAHETAPPPTMVGRPGPGRVGRATFLIAAVGLGFVVRLLPVLQDPKLDLVSDAAYHERLVSATLAQGRLPERDPLSEAPGQRDPGMYLPPALYFAGAAFHRLLGAFGSIVLRLNLMVLIALCGALVAIPVAMMARALFGEARAATIAALVVAALPAHVHRSLGYWVRYDALGTLLAMGHLACAARALTTDRARRRVNAILAALLLVAAAAAWRVVLILPVIETVFVIGWVAARGSGPSMREWFVTMATTGTVLFPTLGYLRAQGFVFSGAWLFTVAVAAALFLPQVAPAGRPWVRALIVAAAGAAGAVVGVILPAPGQYDAVADLVRAKLSLAVLGHASIPPRTMLLLGVEELFGLTPLALLIGPQQLFAVGPWLLAAPFILRRAGRFMGAGPTEHGEAAGLIVFLTAALGMLSLFFLRNEILFGPLVAVWCGGLWCALSRPAGAAVLEARPGGKRLSTGAKKTQRRWWTAASARPVLLGVYALSLIATATCGVLLAASRHPRMNADLRAALNHLHASTPPETVVLSTWDLGYEIQAYAGCATVTDGLLESPANQRAIIESYAAFLERDAAALERFVDRQRVTCLLVPPSRALVTVADVTRAPIVERLERGLPLTAEDREIILLRLMDGRGDPAFEEVSRHGGYRIYRRARAPTSGRDISTGAQRSRSRS